MIITFSIENFRSFRGEETLRLVASNKLADDHPNHLVPVADTGKSVLRSSVLYGANGSGKSNLFRALEALQWIAVESRGKGGFLPLRPFLFSAENREAPCQFDLQILVNGNIYRYGIRATEDVILDEWLLEGTGKKQRPVFTRSGSAESESAEIELFGKSRFTEKVKALAVVGCTPKQSFLAHVRHSLPRSEWGGIFAAVIHWFAHSLVLVGPEAKFLHLPEALCNNEEFRKFAQEFMNEASTGIHDLEIHKHQVDRDQFLAGLPKEASLAIQEELREHGEATHSKFYAKIYDVGDDKLELRGVNSRHQTDANELVSLDLDQESDGTQRLLHLLPALHSLRKSSCVFVVDEIERSLHPLLVRKFMERFLDGCDPVENQLLVTSHETNLLDQKLLRRDEVWFVEKDAGQASHFTPLTDYKIRNDMDLRKNYLEGRFDAVPFLEGVDRLFESQKLRASRMETAGV